MFHRHVVVFCCLVGLLLVGTACGARQGWEGTFEGNVTRRTLATDAGVQEAESLKITRPTDRYSLERKRGTETCTLLEGVFGGQPYPGGGYALTVTAGQECNIDGQTLTLVYGGLYGNNDVELELHWAASRDAGVLFIDTGLLRQK